MKLLNVRTIIYYVRRIVCITNGTITNMPVTGNSTLIFFQYKIWPFQVNNAAAEFVVMKTNRAKITFCAIYAGMLDLERINLQERSGTNALTVIKTSESCVVNHATAAPC